MGKKSKILQNFIWVLLAVQIVVVIVTGTVFQVDDIALTNGSYSILSDGWTLTRSDGSSETVTLPYEGESEAGEILTLEGEIAQKYAGKTIRFQTEDETLQVFLDGTPIYSFGVRDKRLFGRTPGSAQNYIDLPKHFTNGHLRIVLSSPYADQAAQISRIYIGNRDILIVNALQSQLSQLACNVLMLVCGIIFIILLIIQMRGKKDTAGIEYLIAFSVLLGIYYSIQTHILSFFYGNQTLYAMMLYLILALLPLFLVAYYQKAYFKNEKQFWLVLVLGYANVLIQLVLQITNIVDLQRMRYVTVAYIVLALVVILFSLIRERKNNPKKIGQKGRMEIVAIIIFLLSGIVDGILAACGRAQSVGTYSRIGFTIYLLIETFIHLRSVALGYADMVNENIRYEELEKHVQLEELHAEIGVAPDAKILLMDDLEMNRKLMVGLLSQTRIQLDIVGSGKECIEAAKKKNYHIIILDNLVDDMETRDILAAIREQENGLNAHTPVIYQTNNRSGITPEWLQDLGYAAALSKPVEEPELMQLLVDFIPKDLMLNPQAALEREKKLAGIRPKWNAENEQESLLIEILVVDDDAVNRKLAEKILSRRYHVTSAASGEEALEYVSEHHPDLILLDLLMPSMDGREVLKRLQADEATMDIPVIILTAETDQNVQVQLLKEGAVDFITKPFIADLMLQRLGRALSADTLKKDLMHDVNQKTEKLERLTDQIMLSLAGTIDAKDKYTNGHSLRVAEYSKKLANELGKSKSEQEDIYKVGLLHDIGKIGIPDEIINKTTQLDDEEYLKIKQHPQIGAQILENITEMPNLRIGARWHHEKYDGSGYPDHLKGEEIPEWARIIGVADAYDAMASKRSYRDVLPQAVVREEIAKGSGTQFDPVVVEAMLHLIDADKDYDMREK